MSLFKVRLSRLIDAGLIDKHHARRLCRNRTPRAIFALIDEMYPKYEQAQREEVDRLRAEWERSDTEFIEAMVAEAARQGNREILEAIKPLIDTQAKRRAASAAYKKATK